jgi:hypothetical protein
VISMILEIEIYLSEQNKNDNQEKKVKIGIK